MTLLTSFTFLPTPVQQHEIAIAARLLKQGAIRQRNQVQRLTNRLKQFRRSAAHYDKRADRFTTHAHLED